jgi:CheY-like chemotaxis protein
MEYNGLSTIILATLRRKEHLESMAAILLAEDSPTHTALMQSLLEQDAHQVQCVENGRQAVEALHRAAPDLVVTDLCMPEMNGLELVHQLVERFPRIPSIVVTARGSESLAVDALAQGAANFVPKNSLHKLLTHAVRQTLQMAKADRQYSEFTGQLQRPEFSFLLHNDVRSIEPAVLFVVQALAAAGRMNPTHRIRLGTAIASAIFNAICFGNLEVMDEDSFVNRFLSGDHSGETEMRELARHAPYRDRSVELKVSVGDDDTRILVSHDGPGRMTRLTPAPGTPESFELEQCRGLMLMTSFMDDVVFHSEYSEVVMVKRHPQ